MERRNPILSFVLDITKSRIIITVYYMASSASGQDESNPVIGYPRGQDGAILPARDYPPCPAR